MEQVRLQINGQEVVVQSGITIIEAAKQAGIDIPSLCHDSRLEPFGACRLCFVNLKDAPKPVTACSTFVADGMEVTTEDEALAEIRKAALELLLSDHHGDCIAPCQLACPAHIDIQGFLAYIADGQHQEAAKLIKDKLPFASAVGRVCPRFCEAACRRNTVDEPIAICMLKGFAGDQDLADEQPFIPEIKPETGKKVAIIGGGPAGLTAAYYIRQNGHSVTIFEGEKELGGMIRYGIPEYRLPPELLDNEIGQIIKTGIDVKYNTRLGKDFTLKSLKEDGYDAILVAIGCWENTQVDLPGKDLPGVYSGIEMLRKVIYRENVDLGEKVAIMGGGNTAMDAARTAIRLGVKEVTVIYRRTENEMPADPREIKESKEEGIKFQFLTNPVKIKGTDRVTAVECVEMVLGEPDASGRRRPIVKENSEFDIPVDSLILAIGQTVDITSFNGSEELGLDRWNCVDTNDETLLTSIDGVFAAGDCAMGAKTVVEAVGQARNAAISVNKYLDGIELIPAIKEYNCSRGELDKVDPGEYKDIVRQKRVEEKHLAPEIRKDNFDEVVSPFTPEEAMEEAMRCLSCGCQDVFECRLKDLSTRYGIEDEKILKFGYQHPIIDDHSYIVRDTNKCVLCGNCVRICNEVQGASALGFVNRGLPTVVLPALEEALSETSCESCGQCISTCPTGALVTKVTLPKPGPWKTKEVNTVCPHCSIGCSLTVHTAGNKVVEVTTAQDAEVNKGNLCIKGSFEFSPNYNQDRIIAPMISNGSNLQEASWDKAFETIVKGLQSVIMEFGSDSVAVIASPKVTNEDGYMLSRLFKKGLKLNKLSIMGQVDPEIVSYLSKNKSSFDGIENSDLIVVFDADIADNYPVVAQRVRKATRKGASLVVISDQVSKMDSFATAKLTLDEYQKLSSIQEFAVAKEVFIIADGQNINLEQIAFVEELLATKENSSLSILELASNYRGLKLVGFDYSYAEIVEGVQNGTIRALIIVGDEDGVDSKLFTNNLFTIIISPVNQNEFANAAVVMPGTAFAETRGSYINSEGKLQSVNNSLPPVAEKEVWEILSALSTAFVREKPMNFEELAEDVKAFYES